MKIQNICFALVGLTNLSVNLQAQQTKQLSKNILFIAVDDLKPILGCYGDKTIKTPNIDRLASRGTVFLTNYCQQAVSGPTRASIMTGMRPDHTKVWDLKTKMREANPEIVSLPQYLITQGFSTQGIGKIYDPRCVDKQTDALSWSVPYYKTALKYYNSTSGAPALGNYQLKETRELGEKYQNEALEKGLSQSEINGYALTKIRPTVECIEIADNAYDDGANALQAKDILAQLKQKNQPFFLGVGFAKPHLPFVAPKKYWDMYDRDKMPIAAYQEKVKNGVDIAYHTASEIRAYSDIPALLEFTDQKAFGISLPLAKQKELIHGYHAAVSYTDAQVGILLNTLDSLGLTDNTIIVLWGDHGWHLGDHNLWCKHTNFEQATRSPLIISAPGIKPTKTNSPSEFVDVFPTLCELAGVSIPTNLDGKSLVPLMKNPKAKVKQFAISQYPRTANSVEIARLGYADGNFMGYSIRNERYRFTMWLKDGFRSDKVFDKNLIVGTELYDYQKDPLEKVNVVNEKNYQKVALKLNNQMVAFFKTQCEPIATRLIQDLKEKTISTANEQLSLKPQTVTSASCVRSAGGKHDYYSEGTYWWPNPKDPNGKYIQKDGQRNPENFDKHHDFLQELSWIIGTQTSAYILTGNKKYVETAAKHFNAWFADTTTMMNPHLLYSQAIKGVCTGRGIGIIDATPLIEVALSVKKLENSPYFSPKLSAEVKKWFASFLNWLNTHPYGIAEKNWKNNHGTWWHTQAAAYAMLTDNQVMLDSIRTRYKTILLPNQMAVNGSYPEELARTKPYSYMQFNLDGMSALVSLISDKNNDLWNYKTSDGRYIGKGIEFMYPYIVDKTKWTYKQDISEWDEQPRPSAYLFLGAKAYKKMEWIDLWKSMLDKKLGNESVRNLPIKNPLLWMDLPEPTIKNKTK
ncbi:MAG: alginate lyase family protein [Paludibacter sp.]